MFRRKFRRFLFLISILMVVTLFGCSNETESVSENEKVVVGYPDSTAIEVGSTIEYPGFGKSTYVKIQDVNETLNGEDFKGTFKEVRISDYDPDGEMAENLKDIDVNSLVEIVLELENTTDDSKTFNEENIQLLVNNDGEVVNHTKFISEDLFGNFEGGEVKEEYLFFYLTTEASNIEDLSLIIPGIDMEKDVVFEIN